jgi:hypothetical protein
MSRALLAATSLAGLMASVAKTPEMQQRDDVEARLPIIISNLSFSALGKCGYEFRKDMTLLLQRVARDQFADLPEWYRNVVADKATEECMAILRASNEEDMRALWVAVHHLILKVANQGIDVHKDLLLVCSGIETEIMVDEPRYGGAKRIDDISAKMENEARRRGWWPQLGRFAQPQG